MGVLLASTRPIKRVIAEAKALVGNMVAFSLYNYCKSLCYSRLPLGPALWLCLEVLNHSLSATIIIFKTVKLRLLCLPIVGKELINERVRVEDKGLKKQLLPPNYRWSCRTKIAADPSVGGELKIKLRPQTAAW